jgi:hypothetical protein
VRTTIRFVLPLVQVVVAVVLTASNFLRPDTIGDPSWRALDIQFCDGLNAPAALMKFCLMKLSDKWLPGHYPFELSLRTIVYFVLVGLTWYAVGLEIGGNGQSVLTPKTGMRSVADVLAIIFGATLGVAGFLVRRQFGYVSTYSNLVALPYFIWGAAVAVFYGHDLYTSLGVAHEKPTDKKPA